MPWKEHDAMEERFRFIEDWRSEDWTMAELCRFYGVTRGTGYKWLGRYEAEGLEGLRELSGVGVRILPPCTRGRQFLPPCGQVC